MRIRFPFAGVFLVLCLLAGYAGLSTVQLATQVNDKVLHGATFFLLSVAFYWILDTNRRRILNVSLVVCTGILGVGSELLQAFLPNGRVLDVYDVACNVAGSVAAIALCSWYHKRMLERRRLQKLYAAVPGEDEADVELGEGLGAQEEGVVADAATASLEERVDSWDENAVDSWGDAGDGDGDIAMGDGSDGKKRVD